MSDSDNEPGADTEDGGINFEEMLASVKEDGPEAYVERSAADLEAVFDVPVRISVVLGRTKMAVSDLLKLDTGTVIELDRQVGEAVEIFINERLVARGEIVLVESKLGVTMTEIIKPQ
ncbi:MAG: flagellar motor switch protein FliN/FliY [Devosia sp.]